MTTSRLGHAISDRRDLVRDVNTWRKSLHDRPLRVETAAAALAHEILDVEDALDQADALGGTIATLSSLRDACCRLAATASETLAVIVEARGGERPPIAAEHLAAFVGRERCEFADSILDDAAVGRVSLRVYGRMLRDRGQRVLHGLRYLADGADLKYDVSQSREREVVELIALALVLPVALPAPSLTAG